MPMRLGIRKVEYLNLGSRLVYHKINNNARISLPTISYHKKHSWNNRLRREKEREMYRLVWIHINLLIMLVIKYHYIGPEIDHIIRL